LYLIVIEYRNKGCWFKHLHLQLWSKVIFSKFHLAPVLVNKPKFFINICQNTFLLIFKFSECKMVSVFSSIGPWIESCNNRQSVIYCLICLSLCLFLFISVSLFIFLIICVCLIIVLVRKSIFVVQLFIYMYLFISLSVFFPPVLHPPSLAILKLSFFLTLCFFSPLNHKIHPPKYTFLTPCDSLFLSILYFTVSLCLSISHFFD